MTQGLYELKPSDFGKVRTLFASMRFQPFCTAVLAGLNAGRVFVDAVNQPQTALVTRDDAWAFLVGSPDNVVFNQAVNQKLFARELAPETVTMFIFTCDTADWDTSLETVFAPREPIPMLRYHYVCREPVYAWKEKVPMGFRIQRMDDALLDVPALTIPDEVKETLAKWRSLKRRDFRDFGFVAISEDANTPAVVSWATVDAVVDGAGDIGLVTLEDYRRQGLATVTAGAAVAHGFAHGLSELHWTAAADNVGSQHIAEKLGFVDQRVYTAYCLCFDEAYHLWMLAYSHLEAARYDHAVTGFEKAFALENTLSVYAYYDAARAWAGFGDMEKAFQYLHLAVDRGWRSVEPLNCTEFAEIKASPEWTDLMARMSGST